MFMQRKIPIPRIGVMLVVKDEAAIIGPCLSSVQGADQILVADTGSQDGTIDIAHDYGAEVVTIPWTDDYSAARNHALRHMTTDWILVIDADERLITPLLNIRTWLTSNHFEGASVRIHNQLDDQDEKQIVCHEAIRLFRLRPGYAYEGILHEDIGPSIIRQSGVESLGKSPLQLLHLGTLPSLIHAKSKLSRNERLLMKALASTPKDSFLLYGLGVNAAQQKQLERASEAFSQARQSVPAQAAYRPTLYRDASKVYLERGLPHLADQWTAEGLADYPDYADLHLVRGQALIEQGFFTDAMLSLNQALIPSPDHYVTESGASTFLAHTLMGDAASSSELQLLREASQHYKEALTSHPRWEPAWHGLVEALTEMDISEEDISQYIEQQWGSIQFPDATQLLRIYRQAGFFHSTARLCSMHLSHPQGLGGLVWAWLHTERFTEAHELIRQLLQFKLLHAEDENELVKLQVISAWQASVHGKVFSPDQSKWNSTIKDAYDWLLILSRKSRLAATETTYSSTDSSTTPFQELEYKPVTTLVCSVETESCITSWIHWLGDEGFVEPLRQLGLAGAPWDIRCAKALFQAGDPYTALNLLVTAMQEQRLDAEGAMIIGEMLLGNKQLLESLDLLEGARKLHDEEPPTIDIVLRRDRMLAYVYVLLASQHLEKAIELQPEQRQWQEQLESLKLSAQCIYHMPWRTKRTILQRRNLHHAKQTNHLPLHDREG